MAFSGGSAEYPKRGGLQVRPSGWNKLASLDRLASAFDESPTRVLTRVRRFFVFGRLWVLFRPVVVIRCGVELEIRSGAVRLRILKPGLCPKDVRTIVIVRQY